MTDTVNDYIYAALNATYADNITSMLLQWRRANSLEAFDAYVAHVQSETGVSNFNDAEWTFWKDYSSSFDPLTLTPDLWVDSSDAATVTLNGSNVSQINDLSGNGNHLTAVTSTNQPAYISAGVNGLNVMRFDGVDDYLATIGGAAVGTNQPMTVFMVAGRRSGDSGGQILANNSGTPTIYSQTSVWSLFAGSLVASATAVDLSIHVFTAVFNNASSLLRLDRTQIASGTVGTSSYASRAMLVGMGSGGSGPFLGDVCELILVPGTVSSTVRDSCEDYLRTKWGTP